jgi:Ulp1 protease family, C-terminal catalytic domain
MIPGTPPTVTIPLHFGNHWAIVHINLMRREIHFLDSQENEARRADVRRVVMNFIRQREDVFATYPGEEYQLINTRSYQQANSYDCGLYAIENARAMIHDELLTEVVGTASRRDTFHRLYNAAMRYANFTLAERALSSSLISGGQGGGPSGLSSLRSNQELARGFVEDQLRVQREGGYVPLHRSPTERGSAVLGGSPIIRGQGSQWVVPESNQGSRQPSPLTPTPSGIRTPSNFGTQQGNVETGSPLTVTRLRPRRGEPPPYAQQMGRR